MKLNEVPLPQSRDFGHHVLVPTLHKYLLFVLTEDQAPGIMQFTNSASRTIHWLRMKAE